MPGRDSHAAVDTKSAGSQRLGKFSGGSLAATDAGQHVQVAPSERLRRVRTAQSIGRNAFGAARHRPVASDDTPW